MNIRNFCIIAHIDHGKSTLADRMIELTGTLATREMKAQLLDTMELERERGITIKLQPVRMMYKPSVALRDAPPCHGEEESADDISNHNGGAPQDDTGFFQLNLIDTPGHTDFRYEVSRSLAAVEGAILLVDASQGIQAQTLAVLYMAMEHDLTIIPVLNKIDLPAADPEKVSKEVVKLLGCTPEDILQISAKEGTGVEDVLDAVINRVPAPHASRSPLAAPRLHDVSRALIFDAVMDPYQGAVAYVRVMGGAFSKGQTIYLLGTECEFEILDIGHFSPKYVSDTGLNEGEIGYIVTGAKEVTQVRTGDTIASSGEQEALPGYKEVQPMVFAGLYPSEADQYPQLRDALEKLQMNDAALSSEPERNAALGNGFRCGFLGLLHMDIVQERLEREHNCDLVITAPSVLYEVKLQSKNPAEVVRSSLLKDDEPDTALISNPAEFPDPTNISEVREPWVKLEIVCRSSDVGAVMKMVQERRGIQQSMNYLDEERVLIVFDVPLQGIVLDFFDKLKSATAGYGSMSYEHLGYKAGELVKLQILLLGEPTEALSTIVHRSEAHAVGAIICKKLKEVLPKQLYQVPIQAAIGAKIVARETLSAMRKDVTGHLYGGDVTRKRKLLEKQKKGKKRMKQMGKIALTQEAFLAVLKRG
jgi:GTP-binding protein LepA